MKTIKPKKCRICHREYIPVSSLSRVCGLDCAIKYTEVSKKKLEVSKARIARKETKEKLKTRRDWLKEAQIAFNRWIVFRDGKNCISCGTTNPNIQYAAGHFRTRGAAKHLAFNEDNVNSQCNYHCNQMLSGNIREYRLNLIKKIGLDRVEALENDNSTHYFTIDELKAIKTEYKRRLKDAS